MALMIIALGWKKHRTRLEKTSHSVGRNIALGWKKHRTRLEQEHRTRLEKTSHSVGKNIALGWKKTGPNPFVSNSCLNP
jgi:hypothetical protein